MKVLFLLSIGLVRGICINAGGPTTYVNNDNISVECFADEFFTGGTVYTDITMGSGALADLRYGNFSYSIPTAPNLVLITLTFVEPNKTGENQRLFNVLINGLPCRAYTITSTASMKSFSPGSEDFDLYKLVGIKQVYTAKYVAISSGTVKIEFRTKLWNALVSRIQVDDGNPVELVN